MTTEKAAVTHCPSSTLEHPSAALLGVVQEGHTTFISELYLLTDEDRDRLRTNPGETNQHYRFTSPCAQRGCGHWQGQCTLASKVNDRPRLVETSIDVLEGIGVPGACPIQTTCRWRQQEGPSICEVCPAIYRGMNQ